MTTSGQKTILLGPEYDDALREALRDVLIRLGGKGIAHDWALGGSQELETSEVQVGIDNVVVEAETYIGLSLRGPVELVERIRDMVFAMTKRPSGPHRG